MVRLSRPKYAKVIIRNWDNVCWKKHLTKPKLNKVSLLQKEKGKRTSRRFHHLHQKIYRNYQNISVLDWDFKFFLTNKNITGVLKKRPTF